MLSTDQWKEKGAYHKVNGHRIFCVSTDTKHADTILLIHGFPTSSWDWVKIWEPLAESHNLVAMDMLGFGYSDKPNPHHYSIHEQADIIEGLISQLGLQNFHLLAHDYGDTVAQELLARQNAGKGVGDWKSVCFLNGGLFPETHQALFIQKLMLSPLGPLINNLTTQRQFDASMCKVFGPETKPTQAELDGFWALVNQNKGRHIFHNLITYMTDRKTHRERWVAALKEAKVPIGLINGSADPVSGAHMIAHYKNIIGPPKFLAELGDIGHYPQVEAPNEVLRHYVEFLAG